MVAIDACAPGVREREKRGTDAADGASPSARYTQITQPSSDACSTNTHDIGCNDDDNSDEDTIEVKYSRGGAHNTCSACYTQQQLWAMHKR